MTDPLTVIGTTFSLAGNVLQGLRGLDFVRGLVGANVISAYFRHDGTRIEGDEKINVERIPSESGNVLWFHVKQIDDYAFVRFPLSGSGIEELLATTNDDESEDEPLPDAMYWRWVARARTGTIVGGQDDPPSVRVDFVVIGYRPKAILKHFSTS